MTTHLRGFFWTFSLLLLGPGWLRADELSLPIDRLIKSADYKHARWGILAVDASTGKTIYEHNADQLFAPASVTKLYSCAAALVALGADHRFETPVYQRGRVDKGILNGDLILRAQGDLTLGGRTTTDGKVAFVDEDHTYASSTSTGNGLTDTNPLAGLKHLARQIKMAGIRAVKGDILIDDRLFERSLGTGSGPNILTPLAINDNVIDVTITPGAEVGDLATWEVRPACDFVQIDVHVDTVVRNTPVHVLVERITPQRFTVRGQIPVDHKPVVRICPVDDTAGFARALFIDVLRRERIEVKASALRAPRASLPDPEAYAKLERVALFRSPPLSELLKVTLKVSHNLYASTLPLLLAVQKDKRTLKEGMGIEGSILADLGVDIKGISLESGAGGGDGDKVSPRVTVELLRALLKRPDFPVFQACLPILGVDGTLAKVVEKDSPVRGMVFAKTGTYSDLDLLNGRTHLRSKSLAGVMKIKDRTVVFAIFVNDVSLPPGVGTQREGKAIGRLCEILYQQILPQTREPAPR